MAVKPAHLEGQLFDYLGGALGASAVQEVEQHLAECPKCAAAAELFRALKSARRSEVSTAREPYEHPDASEIAALFYGKSSRARAKTAAHVANCRSCAREISEYARAEAAASAYNPAEHVSGEVPATSWEMIREWEESSFAKTRPASDVISQELLSKLFKLIDERRDWLREARPTTTDAAGGAENPNAVPVIVVDRSGQLRRVEIFEKDIDASGADVLRHAEKSSRFDEKIVHVLRDAEGQQRVVSYRVRLDSIRIEEAGGEEGLADYFIVED
jgi:hypothetical protein